MSEEPREWAWWDLRIGAFMRARRDARRLNGYAADGDITRVDDGDKRAEFYLGSHLLVIARRV